MALSLRTGSISLTSSRRKSEHYRPFPTVCTSNGEDSNQHLRGGGNRSPAGRALETLSPSNVSIKLALSEMANTLPQAGEPQRRIPNRSPNDTSVVLWIEAGHVRALLGADLEHAGRSGEGWMAVVACHQDTVPAQLFKVPHHGSTDSDHPEVWQRMLTENPVAVVTPFAGGNVRLPKDSDLERLSDRTSRLYCTTAGSGRPPSRDPAVERMMKLKTPKRRVIDKTRGHRYSPRRTSRIS